MALNFLGLGFTFGAKDLGLEKAQKRFASGFDRIASGIEGFSKTVEKPFDVVGKGLDTVDFALDKAQAKVDEWSQSWKDLKGAATKSIDSVKEAFKPLFDTIKMGTEDVKAAWGNTFGKRFEEIGKKVDKLKEKWNKLISPVTAIKNKLAELGARAGQALKPLGEKFTKVKDKVVNFSKKGLGLLGAPFLGMAKRFLKLGAADIAAGGKKIAGSFDAIKEGMGKLNEILRMNRLQTFIDSVALDKLNKIADGIGRLGTEGNNLTTSLEAEQAAMGKTARAAAVNLGMTGKEIGRFTAKVGGMAKGLNIDVNTAAEATYAWTKAQKELQAVGITSAEDMAKLAEVTGVNSREFSQSLMRMRAEFKLGDKELQQVIGSFTHMGQETGNVGDALAKIPGMMDMLSRKAALMGKKLDPKKLAQFAAETASLTTGLHKMGLSQDKASEFAEALGSSMVEAQEGFQGMFAGVEDELPAFMEELAITSGDVEEAFKMMQEGPAGLVKGLGTMMAKAKKSGADVPKALEFIRARFGKIMGPEQAAMLVNFVGSMDDAMLDTMKTTEKAQKSLGKLAKEGFSTGRTLQESYDMAKDAAIASFRSIGHARESFVKDSAKQFAELSKTLKELAAKGGPMGMVIEKMADMHAIGVKALLPEALRPMAAVMGEMIGEAVPLAGALGSLGFRLGMLFSPFGIILAALTVFGVLLMDARMKTKSWGEALEMTLKRVAEYFQKFKEFALKALDQVLNYLVNFTDDLAKRAKEMDWKKFFQNLFAKVGGALRSAAGAIKDAIGMLWGAITGGLDGESGPAKSRVGKILQNLISVFKNVFSGLFAALKDVDWSASLQAIMSALSAAFAGANKLLKKIPFKEIFGALFDGLGKVLDVLGSEQVGSFLGNLVQSILERGSILIDAIVMLLETGLDKLTNMNLADKLGKVVENALSIILGALEGLIPLVGKILEKLPGLLRKAFDLIIELVKTIPARVGEILKGLGPKLGPLLGKLITILLDFLWEIPGLLKDLVVKLVTSLPDILKGLATLVEGALSLLQDLLINALDAIKEWLIKKFPSAAGPITAVFDGIKKAIQFVFKVVKWFIDGVKKGFQILWDFVKKVWDFLFGDNGIVKVYFQTVFTIISDILSWFVEAWKVAYDFVKAQVENVLGFVGAMWDWIGKVVGTIVEFIYTFVKERYDAVQKVITDVLKAVGKAWDTLKTAVEDIIKGFKDKIDTAFKAIQKTVEDAMKAAGKAWEDFKTVVKDIMDWVEKKALESFKKITDALDGATKKVKEFFIGAEKGAEDTFGNSIHTWVEGDMEKTTKAFDDAGNTIVKAMSTQMHDAVVEALGKAFDEAFKKAAKKTQKFTDDEMVIFNKFLDKLVKAWTDAWRTIVLNTEAAALLINNAVEKVSTSLAATIASYQQAISLRKEADRLAKTSEAETGSSETTPLDASLETLIKVTNEPAWFFGPEGWVEITARNQLALIEVLKSIANAIGKASPAQSGNVAEARRQLGLGPGKGPGGAMPGGRR